VEKERVFDRLLADYRFAIEAAGNMNAACYLARCNQAEVLNSFYNYIVAIQQAESLEDVKMIGFADVTKAMSIVSMALAKALKVEFLRPRT